MKTVLNFLFLFLTYTSVAQNITIEATIINDDFEPGLGRATILKASDSTVLKGTYLDSNFVHFEINPKREDSLIFRANMPGFSELIFPFKVTGDYINLGEIRFVPDQELDEVKVVHEVKMFERTMDGITVNVEGTDLQQLETLFDVLKASPKLTSPDDESIEIIGKGSPLILIDRQAIISNDELKAIPASQIEKIEIITNPGAKYKAQGSGSGVIEVYTKNFKFEGYLLTVSLSGGVDTNKKPQSNGNLSYSYKKKKFSMNAYVGGNFYSALTNGGSIGYLGSESNKLFDGEWTGNTANIWQYFSVKSAYEINEQQKITMGINGHGSVRNYGNDNLKTYYENDSPSLLRTQTSDAKRVWLNNRAFVNYTNELDTNGSVLEVNINFTKKVSESSGIYYNDFYYPESDSLVYGHIKNENRDRPNIGEVSINYEHVFDTTGWKIGIGGTYSMVYNAKFYDQYQKEIGDWQRNNSLSNSYRYNEHIGGGYVEISKQWDKFGIRTGTRFEYTKLDGYSESLSKQFIDSNYFNLFPGIGFMYEPTENVALTLYYLSGIERPRFEQFDPFVTMNDSLSVSYGNPFLKPTYEHDFGLDIDLFYAYSISISYYNNIRPLSSLSFFNSQTLRSESTPWNALSEEGFELSIGAPIKLDWLHGWNSIWYERTNYYFSPEFNRETFNNERYGIYSNLTADLPWKFSIMNRLNINKWGNSDFSNRVMTRWGMRLTKKFNKNGLKIYFDVDNIVPPKNQGQSISGNFVTSYYSNFNFTTFKLGVYFKLGRLKSPTNIEESSSEQSGRI